MPLLGLIMDYGGVLTDGPELFDVPRRARSAGVRTALLTDAHRVPDACADLFDVVVLGAAGPPPGARKPDPEAYRRVAAMLDLTPEQCVVVDDLPGNVRGARAAGAVTIRHEDPGLTVSELEILLDLP